MEENSEGLKNNMRIVIATPILYNSASPFNHLFKDIIGGFLNDGNQIVRLVAVENEKDIEFKYGYVGDNIEYKLFKRKKNDKNNIFSRYITDSITNIKEALAILKLKDVDVLFEDVSYSSFWSVAVAKIKKIKIIAMIQDVWPDNATQSNIISQKSIVYKYFELWQRFVYKNADKIVCISDDMKDFIVGKGISENKIDVIYNWGYSDDIVDIPWEKNKFVKKFNLDKKKFYAIYAGNIGKMQNVGIIVDAAKELEDKEDIHFFIIGDGAKKDDILKALKNVKNVSILPMQPSELALHIYSAAGVNLISLVEGGLKTALPSKTGVVLSCGKPTIFTFGQNSSFIKQLEKFHAGESVEPWDSHGLAKKIIEIKELNQIKSDNVYKFFREYFVREQNIQRYKNLIRGIKQNE